MIDLEDKVEYIVAIYINRLYNTDKTVGVITNKEIAVLLDKARYALIAQKVTGNNDRKVALDMDSKRWLIYHH